MRLRTVSTLLSCALKEGQLGSGECRRCCLLQIASPGKTATVMFYKNISRTSAVSSTNLGSILILQAALLVLVIYLFRDIPP